MKMNSLILVFLYSFYELSTSLIIPKNDLVLLQLPKLGVPQSLAKNEEKESDGLLHRFKRNQQNLPSYPIISTLDVKTNIQNRYAKTLVISRARNLNTYAQEAVFVVVLPARAFISEFFMESGGKNYIASVKDKKEALKMYREAKVNGRSAGHVATSARDSNRFTVSVNVEPHTEATFFLTYEELLERKNGQYEHVLNVYPGTFIQNLHMEVHINESSPLKFAKVISFKTGNNTNQSLLPTNHKLIKWISPKCVVVKFSPTCEEQRIMSSMLNSKDSNIVGQFVVEYDVERGDNGGELLYEDGFFVHYFSPTKETPIPKHIVFVLDSSTSMKGTKIEQLKDAVTKILDDTEDGDIVSIINFNTKAMVLDVNSESAIPMDIKDYRNPFEELEKYNLPVPLVATVNSIMKMKKLCRKLTATGSTNVIAALETALYLVNKYQNEGKNTKKNYLPLIVLLTDGTPFGGIDLPQDIIRIVTHLNSLHNDVPIYSLSFGTDANKDFLEKLSLQNNGSLKHIYDAADASQQLQDFYKQISSPLLTNIKFQYKNVTKVTQMNHPVYFQGTELVVAGRYKPTKNVPFRSGSSVQAKGSEGFQLMRPNISAPVGSVERIWAYLTIKQKLEEAKVSAHKDRLTKEARDLALHYSLVTELTSLVVVTPEGSHKVVQPEAADTDLQFSSVGKTWSSCEPTISSRITDTISYVSCSNSLVNETGICVPSNDCPEVEDFFPTLKSTLPLQYICLIDNRSLGVCCPVPLEPVDM